MTDDLFQPSIDKATTVYSERPWSERANFMVAFFGGVLATTYFSMQNARRLRVTREQRQQILLTGLIGVVLALVAYFVLLPTEIPEGVSSAAAGRTARYTVRGIALVAYFVIERVLKSPRRLYATASDGEHESPWKAGLIAVFVIGTAQALLAALIALVRMG